MSNELKRAGLKVTTPRLKILELLTNGREHHMTAEDIYRHLVDTGHDVGLATVYRVLTQFEKSGIIKRHNFEGGQSVFELQGSHHDHLVCVACGLVEEFFDELIEKQQAIVSERARFQLTDHNLTIYGLCPSCQTAPKT